MSWNALMCMGNLLLFSVKLKRWELWKAYADALSKSNFFHRCVSMQVLYHYHWSFVTESIHCGVLSFCFVQHWFTELPPVLTFELSRFEFNQALGRPEKIHNKLEFPPILYLDRYSILLPTKIYIHTKTKFMNLVKLLSVSSKFLY